MSEDSTAVAPVIERFVVSLIPRLVPVWMLAATQAAGAPNPVLVPGAATAECRSVLHIGVTACRDELVDRGRFRGVDETEVDRALAEYGKPPREAVRALLDPSDENIAAWARKQRLMVVVASYVASRLTEIQSRLEDAGGPALRMPASVLPAIGQTRVTLSLRSADPPTLQAVRSLTRVVARYPAVDARLVQIGAPPEGRVVSWLARLDTTLPIAIAPRATLDQIAPPSLAIEDVRTGSSERIDASGITAQEICDRIAALHTQVRFRTEQSTPPLGTQ